MRIYIDCDDTLFPFTKGILEACNREHGTNLTVDDVIQWAVNPVLPPGVQWWEFTDREGFYRDLEPLPGARSLVNAVRASGRPWGFLTSLPVKHTSSNLIEERRICLDNSFAVDGRDIPSRRLIVAKRKDLVVHEGDVLIDDYIENIKAVEAVGAKGILVKQPSNRNTARPRWTLPEVTEWVKQLPR